MAINIYKSSDMARLLEENGFYFKKKLGQNFLMNESVSRRIAQASRDTLPQDVPTLAIEIGPGAGSLTLQLSKLFDHVLALEIDPHLIPVLSVSLADAKNVTVECCDALKYPFSAIRETYPSYAVAVCANLPYYLTSEMLMTLLESKIDLRSVTVLIQQEAADRLTALPGTPQYGSITAAVSFYAETEKLFRVGPGNFIPRPKVDSAVLRMFIREKRPVQPKSVPLFFSVIKAAFSARRKTLSNALSISFPSLSKEQILFVLENSGIEPNRRGETLSLQEFCTLSDHIHSLGGIL